MEEEFNIETASYKDLILEVSKRGLGSGVGISAKKLRESLASNTPIVDLYEELNALKKELAEEDSDQGYHVFDKRGDLIAYVVGESNARNSATDVGGFIVKV